jgi:hypothetical protein
MSPEVAGIDGDGDGYSHPTGVGLGFTRLDLRFFDHHFHLVKASMGGGKGLRVAGRSFLSRLSPDSGRVG